MHCFYCEEKNVTEGAIRITGSDVNHIKNVLRMRAGEPLTVCDGTGMEYSCEITEFLADEVVLRILKKAKAQTELTTRLVLYQGLPKKDKMELIIQKAVELGAAEIVPVMTKRCIVKLEDDKKEAKKLERWQAIAESAAKQSGRAVIPAVTRVMSYREALKRAKENGMGLIPYECAAGMKSLKEAASQAADQATVSIFIGPEGGFEEAEVEAAKEHGIVPVSLGKRILRTETAGFTTLSILMYEIECATEMKE
ncbi:MAG: 16S rRNA (uracil(1498)-N(3))-methyltransferase [Lachnospiraceae bacterium]|nr:16S rRNA (uracil(1498)-N(3))-methyltransferase [Lachnospiraceae bacterium]